MRQSVILGVADENGVALVVGGSMMVDLINQLGMPGLGRLELVHGKSLRLGTDSAVDRELSQDARAEIQNGGLPRRDAHERRIQTHHEFAVD